MNTISNERLESLQRQFKEEGFNDISDSEIMQLVEENLALRKEREKAGRPQSELSQRAQQILRDATALAEKLSAETDPTAQQFESLAGKAVVPEGWKLVPVELTKEMLQQIHPFAEATCFDCGNQVVAHCADNVTASWNDMLAVAPEPCK
ncbi:hypothetical protein PU783_000296 [Cronobacter sakazakii]|nr:hypothetical protein [Cronobacter sakazakii]EKM6438166.1 hypothetical protein [Cronobacter sakazakii]